MGFKLSKDDIDMLREDSMGYTTFLDKVSTYKKAGFSVLDAKHSSSKSHITMVDKEGIKKTYHYTPGGTKVENHGPATGSEKADVVDDSPKRGRGRPTGSKSGSNGLQVK